MGEAGHIRERAESGRIAHQPFTMPENSILTSSMSQRSRFRAAVWNMANAMTGSAAKMITETLTGPPVCSMLLYDKGPDLKESAGDADSVPDDEIGTEVQTVRYWADWLTQTVGEDTHHVPDLLIDVSDLDAEAKATVLSFVKGLWQELAKEMGPDSEHGNNLPVAMMKSYGDYIDDEGEQSEEELNEVARTHVQKFFFDISQKWTAALERSGLGTNVSARLATPSEVESIYRELGLLVDETTSAHRSLYINKDLLTSRPAEVSLREKLMNYRVHVPWTNATVEDVVKRVWQGRDKFRTLSFGIDVPKLVSAANEKSRLHSSQAAGSG
jgi:hypothetical protein